MQKFKPYVFAVAGGVGAALAVLSPVVHDGVDASEWIQAALAFLAGSGLTAYRPTVKTPDVKADAWEGGA